MSKIHTADSPSARAVAKSGRFRYGARAFVIVVSVSVVVFACLCGIPILLYSNGDKLEALASIPKYPGHAMAWGASWSPDGNRIAASLNDGSGFAIYSMNIDGTDVQRLTPKLPFPLSAIKSHPAWSPDGRYILYFNSSWMNTRLDLYRINADGSNPVNLTKNGVYSSEYDWSPNAKYIVFLSNQGYPDSYAGHPDMYTMDSDGLNINQLTETASAEFYPRWSPDNNHIAVYGNGGLTIMNADGSNAEQLTNILQVDTLPADYLAWSPDGKKLAFSSLNKGGKDFYDADLYLVDLDGTNMTKFSGAHKGIEPVWSPDGTRIAFISGDGVYVCNPSEGSVELLTNNNPNPSSLSWSPDGKQIMFISASVMFGFVPATPANSANFHSAIFVMNADGSNKIQLTTPFGK